MAREKEPPKVRHRTRPELGVGEVHEIVVGKPPVIQVYWPDVEKYGHYLATDLVRIGAADLAGAMTAAEAS